MEQFNPNSISSGAPGTVVPVGKGTRFLNGLIDGILLALVSNAAGRAIGSTGLDPNTSGSLGFLVGLVVQYAYYYLQEVGSFQTLGKRVTSTRVVMTDGSNPTPEAIRKRSLWRLIPLLDALSFLFSDVGWHDKYSDTRVVAAK